MARLRFALSFLEPSSSENHLFDNMHSYVHVDEKWFYLTKVRRKFYVYEDEEIAARSVKSKGFITKVMFLAAVARPRYDYHRKTEFDGKIGVWLFVELVPAKQSSKDRPKGSIVVVPKNVDSLTYQSVILEKVIPAIKEKFPRAGQAQCVTFQQDNASPHKCLTTEFLAANGVNGVSVVNQPANSPDFNVLVLGFFNSIQSLQYQKTTRTIEEVILAVEDAFRELPSSSLSKNFLTLQKVMEISMSLEGDNNYKLPHMRKDVCIENLLEYNVECDQASFENTLIQLDYLLGEEANMEGQMNSFE
ncbi:hypothetical protein Ae201684P_015801 [Aphanomyces euteiches]|uniref:Tc1-like transposase DDE domain-containing protein n=1 Tax=Aphanomyces euteiches TaxID=100861 RepID=A0A6G0WIH2_9STRA|nr:hypothetical protein Ae201684_014864 [Aphanomyces euteiches]KAH9072730.1 hypothetical protein Ae201684P_015801 [Aphanomyces euteiches]